MLMEEAGKLACPDKIEIIRKNNKQKLYNDIIDLLQQNKLEWSKDMVLSQDKLFVSQ